MKGLSEIYQTALTAGTNVVAIAPLAAPGFVSQSDYKEGERLKLAAQIKAYADNWNKQHPEGPAFEALDLGVNGPMNFWRMGDQERKQWLDDGLHLTKDAYDRMGGYIADAMIPKVPVAHELQQRRVEQQQQQQQQQQH